jgi:ribosomal silencing factor RsfS
MSEFRAHSFHHANFLEEHFDSTNYTLVSNPSFSPFTMAATNKFIQKALQRHFVATTRARLSETTLGGIRRLSSDKDSEWIPPHRPFSGDQGEKPEFSEWIPPDRPLSGDQGQSHLFPNVQDQNREEGEDDEEWELRRIEEELRLIEEQESAKETKVDASIDADPHVDWLKTRRSVLGQEGLDMMTPAEAVAKKQEMSDIPIKEHMLLSKDEIATCLDALGGRDITVVLDNPLQRRMGGPNGMVFVTVSSNSQMRSLADALVRQMRRRKLQEVGVLGAELGPEGNDDATETWMVVDCMNYIVHFQDKKTRKALNLEALWSGKDKLHKLNMEDEDACDDYVVENPVPDDYGASSTDWDETLKRLEKNKWTAPHRRVVAKSGAAKRAGR